MFLANLLKVKGSLVATSKFPEKYFLLTEFEVRTVSYGPCFFARIYIAQEQSARAINPNGKNWGSVTYSTDRENEVSKIFIISLGQRDILRGDQNELLNSAGRTIEYGPLNWPITARLITERYNMYFGGREVLTTAWGRIVEDPSL